MISRSRRATTSHRSSACGGCCYTDRQPESESAHFTLSGSQAFVLMRHEDSNVFSAFDTKQLDDVRFAGCVHARCYDTLRGVSRGSRALICRRVQRW
jgi:hypothetical protein